MRKLTHEAPRARFALAVLALSVLAIPACDDDTTAPFPSRGPATDMTIYTIPSNMPFVLVRDQSLRLIGVPVDDADTWVEAPVTWSVSNPAVASIDDNGVVTAIGNVNASQVDTVIVTATSAGQTATQEVIIRRFPAVETIAISAVTPFLAAGQTVQLTARALDAAGAEIVGRDLAWASSNANIATVTSSGLVSVVGSGGTATVTATAQEDGEDVVGSITISAPEVIPPGAFQPAQISDGSVAEWVIVVPAGASRLVVQTSGGTGDADMYLYPPNARPTSATGAGWVCRPWEWGSEELCTVDAPAAGTWGLRLEAYPGEGDVSGITITVTID